MSRVIICSNKEILYFIKITSIITQTSRSLKNVYKPDQSSPRKIVLLDLLLARHLIFIWRLTNYLPVDVFARESLRACVNKISLELIQIGKLQKYLWFSRLKKKNEPLTSSKFVAGKLLITDNPRLRHITRINLDLFTSYYY